MRSLVAVVQVLAVLLPVAVAHATPETCPVFILRHVDGGFAIVPDQLADGEVCVLESNTQTGIVDVILPPGPGQSASVERLAGGRMIIARYAAGRLSITTRLADGKEYARPARELADLKQFDVRVSVTAADRSRAAFIIRAYDTVSRDDVGPVIDLFGGKVPLAAGDYAVTTQTTRRPDRAERPAGEVRLDWLASPVASSGYLFAKAALADGPPADFVVDLAAGQTVVSKAALPTGTPIEQAAMLEHSATGTRQLKYTIGGATGDVQSIIGFATLPSLRVGSVTFRDVHVTVMSSTFKLGDRTVDGILGVDLLRQAGRITIVWPRDDRPARLVLGADEPAQPENAIRTAISSVGKLVYIRGEIAGQPVSFVLDTGSATSFLDPDAAKAVGVVADASAGRQIHGLDGGATTVRPATVDALTVGGKTIRDVPFEVGQLPVLDAVRTGQHVGLLGNSFFTRFDRLVVDFNEAVVTFVP